MAGCDDIPVPAECRPVRSFAAVDYGARRHLHIPDNWGSHWTDALAEADDRVVKVHVWGDSITVGDDASGGLTANTTAQREAWLTNSYVGRLAAALQDRRGDAGSGFVPIGLAVTTGTWTAGIGYGGPRSTATAAASMTWTKVRGTEVRIYAGQTGSFRYQIDGGSFTTVTTPVDFGIDPATVVVTGLSDTEHTVRVEWVSGTVALHGVEGRRGTAGVRVARLAQHGQAASHYSAIVYRRIVGTITNGANTFSVASPGGLTQFDSGKYILDTAGVGQIASDTILTVSSGTAGTLSNNASGTATREFMLARQPGIRTGLGAQTVNVNGFNPNAGQGQADLVILALGVNDPTNLLWDEQTFRDGLSTLLKPYSLFNGASDPHYTPDFLFLIHHQGAWFDVAGRWPGIAQSIYDMAAGVGGAVLDMWGLGGRSWNYARHELAESSYWSGASGDNQIHPSPLGHEIIGDALVDLLAA